MHHWANHPFVLILQEALFGFSLSGLWTAAFTETVHAVAVISTGLLLTVLTHFVRKYLKKYHP